MYAATRQTRTQTIRGNAGRTRGAGVTGSAAFAPRGRDVKSQQVFAMAQQVIIHGNLEKRSMGKSFFRATTGVASWKERYIVVFPTEVRWYEKAETDAKGNAVINSKRCGFITLGPESTLEKNLDYESGKYWTFGLTPHPSSSQRLVMKAMSDAERQDWTSVLETVLDKLRQPAAPPEPEPSPQDKSAPPRMPTFPDPPQSVGTPVPESREEAKVEEPPPRRVSVSYTHLRAHETLMNL
eukprot:3073602-Prymnesium_polylepis.1